MAACGTWVGDFFTAWMVSDMMLQERYLYPQWAWYPRNYWRTHPKIRITLFWSFGEKLELMPRCLLYSAYHCYHFSVSQSPTIHYKNNIRCRFWTELSCDSEIRVCKLERFLSCTQQQTRHTQLSEATEIGNGLFKRSVSWPAHLFICFLSL